MKLETPCCTVPEIAGAAMQLLTTHYDFAKPLRSLGVRACGLRPLEEGMQLGFFEDAALRERRETMEFCIGYLRERFGQAAVRRARLIGANIIGESDPLTHEVHPVAFFRYTRFAHF